MVKRISFYVVSVSLVAAFMISGCAKQDVVKKDEGIPPVPVAKPADSPMSDKPMASAAPSIQSTVIPATQAAPSPASAQPKNASSMAELQSALNTIYFDFDSAGLSESARNTLTKNAAALAKATTATVRIEGNCDERGSAEYNLALGERRAKAAQQYLTTLGVKPDRLSIISYGKEKPAVQGDDEAAWSKNRRAEFLVTAK